jgi:ABC-type histidine transport system ATPase subunit
MAQSVRDQIIAKAVEVLNAPTDKPVTAFRSRTDALSAVEAAAKAVVVYPMKESGETAGRTISMRSLTMRCEAITAGDPPQDQALDEVLVYITRTYTVAVDDPAVAK